MTKITDALHKVGSVVSDLAMVLAALDAVLDRLTGQATSQSSTVEYLAAVRQGLAEVHTQAIDSHCTLSDNAEGHIKQIDELQGIITDLEAKIVELQVAGLPADEPNDVIEPEHAPGADDARG